MKWKDFFRKLCAMLVVSVCAFVVPTQALARTEDVGVLEHLEECSDFYSYLNNYHYRIWYEDNRYLQHHMYINSDNTVIASFFNGRLDAIFIRKVGYSTDKGIQVGRTVNDVYHAYGEPDGLTGRGMRSYSGYRFIEYVSPENEGLSFVFDQSERVVLIRYQKNRHGNTRVIDDMEKYTIIPGSRG